MSLWRFNIKLHNTTIVFFDGHCSLCNGFVDFLLKRSKSIHFAPLQGVTAGDMLEEGFTGDLQTVVLIHGEKVFTKSAAILMIFKLMKWPWKLLYVFITIPKFIRDGLYDLLARHRTGLFGSRDQCRVGSADEKNRILP